jgi:ABC-type transport system involved in cytochrome c biogenesis permease subunit
MERSAMNSLSRYLPWGVVALAALFLVYMAVRPKMDSGRMDLEAFGRLPIHEGGRVQPFDSVARHNLMLLSGMQSFRGEDGVEHSALKWLLDVMVSAPGQGGPADKHKVFRIVNDQVLSLLGLEPRSGFRYALEEFFPRLEEFYKQAKRAQAAQKSESDKKLDLYDTKLLELADHFERYVLLSTFQSPRTIPPANPGEKWQAYAQIEANAKEATRDRIRAALVAEGVDLDKLNDEQMQALSQRFLKEQARVLAEQTPPSALALLKMLRAYKNDNANEFNQAVAQYRDELQRLPAADVKHASFEAFFDHFAPFSVCAILYIIVFLLACIGWITVPKPLHRAALWLAILTLVVHTGALFGRIYLNGRPPVTNLYSSAVFIGWGCVGLALVLECIFRIGVATAIGGVLGALTLVIAHYLGLGSDTLEPMEAVLATQFWLATHVVCVTFGYTATFVAGFFGTAFILLGVFTPWLTKDLFKILGRIIYGVVCFATLLSFVGTVLGGIWADQSWGRFWGWDPKENGALLIVLTNALILHARWGGMIQQRGMAVLTQFGNIVTAWSWFGVNMLGVGLHSYGFMSAAVFVMAVFIFFWLIMIGIGSLVPLRMWQSFQPRSLQPPPATPLEPARHVRDRRGASNAVIKTR